jgi:hypothetical protein
MKTQKKGWRMTIVIKCSISISTLSVFISKDVMMIDDIWSWEYVAQFFYHLLIQICFHLTLLAIIMLILRATPQLEEFLMASHALLWTPILFDVGIRIAGLTFSDISAFYHFFVIELKDLLKLILIDFYHLEIFCDDYSDILGINTILIFVDSFVFVSWVSDRHVSYLVEIDIL